MVCPQGSGAFERRVERLQGEAIEGLFRSDIFAVFATRLKRNLGRAIILCCDQFDGAVHDRGWPLDDE